MTINRLDAADGSAATEERTVANAQGALDVVHAGAADQEPRLDSTARGASVEPRTSPTGTPGVERSIETLGRPPFVRVGRN